LRQKKKQENLELVMERLALDAYTDWFTNSGRCAVLALVFLTFR
jgi:hypothetical protein